MARRVFFLFFILSLGIQSAHSSPKNDLQYRMSHKQKCYLAVSALSALSLYGVLVVSLVPHQWYGGEKVSKTAIHYSIAKLGYQKLFEALFENLTKEQIFELSSHGFLGELESPEELTVEYLRKLYSEIYYPTRFSKLHTPGPFRDQAQAAIKGIVYVLEESPTKLVLRSDVLRQADAYITRLKQKEGGEFYRINTIKYPRLLFSWDDVIYVPHEVQQKIGAAFEQSSKFPLTSREQAFIDHGEFSRQEIFELRAIRKASQIFERSSVLNGLPRGGFWNNIKAEVVGQHRQVCSNCSRTYNQILAQWQKQGLIKNFQVTGEIQRSYLLDDKHAAVRLMGTSGRSVVFDAWHENGGSAAHVVTEADWMEKRDFNDIALVAPE